MAAATARSSAYAWVKRARPKLALLISGRICWVTKSAITRPRAGAWVTPASLSPVTAHSPWIGDTHVDGGEQALERGLDGVGQRRHQFGVVRARADGSDLRQIVDCRIAITRAPHQGSTVLADPGSLLGNHHGGQAIRHATDLPDDAGGHYAVQR